MAQMTYKGGMGADTDGVGWGGAATAKGEVGKDGYCRWRTMGEGTGVEERRGLWYASMQKGEGGRNLNT